MFILKKNDEFYVGGALIWSRFDIRAILFPTAEEAERQKSKLDDAKSIEIKKRDV